MAAYLKLIQIIQSVSVCIRRPEIFFCTFQYLLAVFSFYLCSKLKYEVLNNAKLKDKRKEEKKKKKTTTNTKKVLFSHLKDTFTDFNSSLW